MNSNRCESSQKKKRLKHRRIAFQPNPNPSLVFKVCLDLVSLLWPISKQYLTLRCSINYYVSTHLRENQLALGSSGISPLTSLELPKLHPGLMDRSPKFRFVSSDKRGKGYSQRNILVTIVHEFNILHGLETS